MKKIVLLLLALPIFIPAMAQYRLEAEFGLADHSMSYLKTLNRELLQELPIKAAIVSNFEPFVDQKIRLNIVSGTLTYGMALGFQSNGSRISSKDYSGEYLFDMRVQSIGLGICAGLENVRRKHFLMQTHFELGYLFGSFNYSQSLMLNGYGTQSVAASASSENLYFQPDLRLGYTLKKVCLFAKLGYLLQLDSYPIYSGDQENTLKDTKQRDMTLDWSGLRPGLGVSVDL